MNKRNIGRSIYGLHPYIRRINWSRNELNPRHVQHTFNEQLKSIKDPDEHVRRFIGADSASLRITKFGNVVIVVTVLKKTYTSPQIWRGISSLTLSLRQKDYGSFTEARTV